MFTALHLAISKFPGYLYENAKQIAWNATWNISDFGLKYVDRN